MVRLLANVMRIPELRVQLVSLIALVGLYRVLANILLPEIDTKSLPQLIDSSELIQLLFATLSPTPRHGLSVMTLGVLPFLIASRICKPRKTGRAGRFAILVAVSSVLAPVLLYGAIGANVLTEHGVLAIVALIAGGVVTGWIAERLDRRQLHGIGVLILCNVLSSAIERARGTEHASWTPWVILGVVSLIVVVTLSTGSVAQRRIPLQQVRRDSDGRALPGRATHMPFPLPVDQSGRFFMYCLWLALLQLAHHALSLLEMTPLLHWSSLLLGYVSPESWSG